MGINLDGLEQDIILQSDNISKQYRLGNVGTGTLSHDLNRWWHKIIGKPDPYATIGSVNNRSASATEDYVWAIKNINFKIKRGEVLGIIGKNGAGKSTILKILSRVTAPTIGEIKTKGRIASLLEVGTGFHPELTGKENIYLNGAILGMTKAEINSKITEIIEFSGCQMFIETPVKRYSSGMRVRLAFAVAAFLEPDILVIDEVLAVGDAEFQKKAIGKMQDISKGDGRTVIFVSHNMAAVKNLCTRALVLENGHIVFDGNQNKAIDFYLSQQNKIKYNSKSNQRGLLEVCINDISFQIDSDTKTPTTGKPLSILFQLKNNSDKVFNNLRLDFKIEDLMGKRIGWFSTVLMNTEHLNFHKTRKINFHFEKLKIMPGEYVISYNLLSGMDLQEEIKDVLNFEISEGVYYDSSYKIRNAHTPILYDFTVTDE